MKHLVNSQHHGAGEYRTVWDGTDDAGGRVTAGTYFSRINAGTYTATTKMVLVK